MVPTALKQATQRATVLMKRDRFGSTHWSILWLAAEETPAGEAALARVCRDYRGPIYAFFRAHHHDPEVAQDLTQEFFAENVATRRIFRGMDPSRGPFRALLITAAKRMLIDFGRWQAREVRGGKVRHISWDAGRDVDEAERRYLQIADAGLTPDEIFHQEWILTFLDRVRASMREAYRRRGREALFDALEECLPGRRPSDEGAARAAALGRKPETLRQDKKRLLAAYRATLWRELRRTVGSEEAVAEEWAFLGRRGVP